MLKYTFPLTISFLLIFLSVTPVLAQEYGEERSAEQKAWTEYMTPGVMHKMMAKSVGEWNTEATMWMAPEAPPTTSKGTAVSEMLLGGRYLKTTHTGSFMGMEMHGISIDGYDNKTKEFNSLWIDNFGTGFMLSKGHFNKETNTLHYQGSSVNPVTGEDLYHRMEIKIIDDDHQVMNMYMKNNAEEYKTLEVKYTRKK